MKVRLVVCALTCIVVAGPALGSDTADKVETWCEVGGSWYATADGAPWIASFNETSFVGGTLIAQWTGGDGDWYGYCPGSVRFSSGIGSWTRKGPHALLYTIITFSLDANGEVVCVWKLSGRIRLDSSCDAGSQSGSVELFDPAANPFTDEPYHWFPRGEETRFRRISVDPDRD